MKQTIDLNKFIQMGGEISLLDLNKTKCTYYGWSDYTIHSIRENGGLFFVVFTNGKVYNFAGVWIETQVEMVLAPHYKPTNSQ